MPSACGQTVPLHQSLLRLLERPADALCCLLDVPPQLSESRIDPPKRDEPGEAPPIRKLECEDFDLSRAVRINVPNEGGRQCRCSVPERLRVRVDRRPLGAAVRRQPAEVRSHRRLQEEAPFDR